MPDYTITNLNDVEDQAPGFGEVRFPRTAVDAADTGFAYQHLLPDTKQPFGHRHDKAEEIYFVISGSGSVKLDGDVKELRRHDILRIAPKVARSFASGSDGLELVVFGPHHEKDGELIDNYWDQ